MSAFAYLSLLEFSAVNCDASNLRFLMPNYLMDRPMGSVIRLTQKTPHGGLPFDKTRA